MMYSALVCIKQRERERETRIKPRAQTRWTDALRMTNESGAMMGVDSKDIRDFGPHKGMTGIGIFQNGLKGLIYLPSKMGLFLK